MKQESIIRILLIEDDEDDYLITLDMLRAAREMNFSLDWTATYQAGWEALQTKAYHAVLVDYDMGQKNGIDLIQAAIASGYQQPIIMLTGRGGHEVKVQAITAGAADYLSKLNITPLILEQSVKRAIELRLDNSF